MWNYRKGASSILDKKNILIKVNFMPKKKDWLIRTKTHHILGPVSREKILELIDGGSMDPTDELCCGDGFWFYVKEGDLIEKYVRQGKKQPFNDILEATNPNIKTDLLPTQEKREDDQENNCENSTETDELTSERRAKKENNSHNKQLVINELGEEKYIPCKDDLEYPDDD